MTRALPYLSPREFKALAVKGAAAGSRVRKDLAAAPSEDAGDRRLRFTISTGAVDRDLDTIDPEGWDLKHYLTNPVVLLNHASDEMPIGKCVEIGLDAGALKATVEFVPASVPVIGPVAESVYQLCRLGFLNATSVGFIPLEVEVSDDPERGGSGVYPGLDISRASLHEFSIVTVPANPEALIEPGQQVSSEIEAITASLHRGIAKARRARVLRLLSLA